MTKRQKKEQAQYQTTAMIHVRKRLAQRYPDIYKEITMKDIRQAPSLRLFPTRGDSRIVTAVLVDEHIIYIVQSVAKNMIHTVLTEAQVKELIEEGGLDIRIEESMLRDGIESKYKTYKRYMEVRGNEQE